MTANVLLNIKPKRILIITQRYLGDTLLITPLIHSLKQAYPASQIHVLLPKGNAGILEGNPEITELVFFPHPTGIWKGIRFLTTLFRRFDLAISLQTSDRTTLCAIIAGQNSLGFIDRETRKNWWKKLLLSRHLVFEGQHAVIENLRFCQLLGIKAIPALIAPQSTQTSSLSPKKPYAVLHIMPQWRFKQWHINGWLELIDFLIQKGLSIVLSGSKHPEEQDYLNKIIHASPHSLFNLAGMVSIAELSDIITSAEVYIGPDTGITHLAAATGTNVIALFGPTDPKIWAPWPANYAQLTSPFTHKGSQTVNNVTILQDVIERDCMPCRGEGCNKHRNSHSLCLDSLTSSQVIYAIQTIFSSACHTSN